MCRVHRGDARARSLRAPGKVLVARPWLRALAAWVGAQSALLYGYALWGGLKEVGDGRPPPGSALVWPALRTDRARGLSSARRGCALLLGVLSRGPRMAAACRGCRARRHPAERGLRGTLRAVAGFTAFLVLLALPTLVARAVVPRIEHLLVRPLANLVAAARPAQIAGIWPSATSGSFPTGRRRT